MGSQPEEFEEFAACLRALRGRARLSYGELAGKTGIGRSSLHRYCSGSYIPKDYGPAHRFATACGASSEELRRLHRLWSLADAAREPDRGEGEDANADTEADTDAASGATPDEPPVAEPPTPHPPSPWYRRSPTTLLAVALVLALGATALAMMTTSGDEEEGLLFSPKCAEPVGMGRKDACAREVQRLLERAGAELEVDGEFGPETLRRVTAFQVLSGIDANGVVGEETKKALYEPPIRMDTWPAGKVRERVRKVFREAPDRAVAIADCQSFLDPLHMVPNPNGTRNWGVFQISDTTLRKLGGTPRDAMDPEWNIQAAHRLWNRSKNFADWPHCDEATSPEAVGPALVRVVGDRPARPPKSPKPSASPTGACPASGQRFKTPTDDRVYLVGPGGILYYIPDAAVYFSLWNDWSGVAVLSTGVFADCGWDKARELANGILARTRGSSQPYIWDAWYGYRAITNRTAFDKYGFSETKIQTRPSLSPVSDATGWQ
ncbi:helix-turn-helix domain-containing protein [Streptomyces lanatus]|uniref:Helix-turn-helix domain-containing protein n=1 Tax=Streptomyces lanatus TaxID=66900 RepID=A0ABV1XS33_9ACTN|nr:helix-turn-helix domain-containing protein [Streptomyces lanatus]GHH04563.1 hypothetical protein GCM10018780_35130 [Streptomyces lanatus]